MSTISNLGTVANQASSFLNPPEPEIVRNTGSQTLDVNDFLHLITVQLTAQDPLKPMEDTQFISQMASFTSLEQMKALSDEFAHFNAEQKARSAQDYLGKTVTVATVAGDVTGQVSKVSFEDGVAYLSVGSGLFDANDVVSISTAATPATTTNTSSSN